MFLFCSTRQAESMSGIRNDRSFIHRLRIGNGATRCGCDHAVAACGGDLRATVRALILANEFLDHELETKVSQGYVRGVKHGRVKYLFGLGFILRSV